MDLKTLLETRRLVVTSDIQVPPERDPKAFVEENAHSWEWADVLRLKVDPAEIDFKDLCEALRRKGYGLELEIRTRNLNRLEILSQVLKAYDVGVENYLFFTQDYWISGDSLEEIMNFNVDVEKIFSVVGLLREGRDVDGHEISPRRNILVGAGIDLQADGAASDTQMREIELLVRRGVGYLVSKPVFDGVVFERFMKRVSVFNIPVIAEVMRLPSAGEALLMESAGWFTVPRPLIERLERAQDRAGEATAIIIELIHQMKEHCAGFHIVPYGNMAEVAQIVKSLRQ